MYGVIASAIFFSDIVEGIKEEPVYSQKGQLSEEDFIKYCLEASRIHMSALVIDLDATKDEYTVLRGIKRYKMLRPKGRVIVLAVDRKPGNKALSHLVSLGVFDIITPSVPDTEEEETEIDIAPFIEEQVSHPSTYADASRFHLLTEEIENQATVNKETKQKTRIKIQKQTVFKEKFQEKEIIRNIYQTIPSKVVVVGSLYQGAGSTILATNLARMVAKRGIDVAYVEHPMIKPYMYDYLQIHTKTEQVYVDISREIYEEGTLKSKKDIWRDREVKWHVIDSRKEQLPGFSYENLLVLSHSMAAGVLIIDISDKWLDPEIQKFLYIADSILLCIEPDPIKFERTISSVPKDENILHFLNSDDRLDHYDVVLMKDNKNIDNRVIKQMLDEEPQVRVPFIPYEKVMNALFNMKLLYDFEDNGSIFEKSLLPIIKDLVPDEVVHLPGEKKGFMKSLFSKKQVHDSEFEED